ncbi:MAG: YkuS family protein [Firmicutes bacterium]|nr:YkuS family protein [Bacillota bacterium]
MGKKIGIQPTLTPVKEFLNEKGYDVVTLRHGIRENIANGQQFDAIVVTGISENFLNMQDTVTDAVVIDASGLTPAEIENQIRTRTNP